MKKIVWGSNRQLKEHDCSIEDYYRKLAESWNGVSEHIPEPTDGRTNHYRAYNQFFQELVYMWDMILQNKREQEVEKNKLNEQVQDLQKKLSKWTEQQKGGKPKLTSQNKNDIKEWKKKGISNREIAGNIGVSEGTIRRFLKSESNGVEEKRV